LATHIDKFGEDDKAFYVKSPAQLNALRDLGNIL